MNNDNIQLPLTASQYQQLKSSKNLKADLAAILPKAKLKRIETFLNDPDYQACIVRPFKGRAAYLLLRLGRPIQRFWLPTRLHRMAEKVARKEAVSLNQFIKAAIRNRLDAQGVKHS